MIAYNGEEVWPDGRTAPQLNSIGIALGRIPRFCGHTREWYPVLAHVLTVAASLPDNYALFGLLHDAPEACMSDVPTPWKTEAARRREYMLLRRIYQANGLDWPISEKAQEAIDWADAEALKAEAHTLGHPRADIFGDPLPVFARLTQTNLEDCYQMLEPDVAGKIFEEAFSHYNKFLNQTLRSDGTV